MARLLCFRAAVQRVFEEWLDDSFLDYGACAADCGEWGCYGF
jgi:hypothetical protein